MGPGEARGGRRRGAHPCRTRGDEAWSRSALPAPEEPPPPAAGPPAAGLRDCGVLFPFLTPQLAAPQNQCALLSKSSSSRVAVRCEGKPRGLARRAPARGQVPASLLPPLAPPWPAPASAPSRWAEGVTACTGGRPRFHPWATPRNCSSCPSRSGNSNEGGGAGDPGAVLRKVTNAMETSPRGSSCEHTAMPPEACRQRLVGLAHSLVALAFPAGAFIASL